MSIQGEIDRISDNIALSYGAVEEKGGALPADQNSGNLPDAVRSIPTGALLESISVVELPTKVKYYTGTYFERSGMKVQALYTNGATKEVSDYIVSTGFPELLREPGMKDVVVTYTEFGITRTAGFQIEIVSITPVMPTSLNPAGDPND